MNESGRTFENCYITSGCDHGRFSVKNIDSISMVPRNLYVAATRFARLFVDDDVSDWGPLVEEIA